MALFRTGPFKRAHFQATRLTVHLNALIGASAFYDPAERVNLGRHLLRGVQQQRQTLAQVETLLARFRDEYGETLALVERAAKDLAREPESKQLHDLAGRYADLFEDRDRRLHVRAKMIRHVVCDL